MTADVSANLVVEAAAPRMRGGSRRPRRTGRFALLARAIEIFEVVGVLGLGLLEEVLQAAGLEVLAVDLLGRAVFGDDVEEGVHHL